MTKNPHLLLSSAALLALATACMFTTLGCSAGRSSSDISLAGIGQGTAVRPKIHSTLIVHSELREKNPSAWHSGDDIVVTFSEHQTLNKDFNALLHLMGRGVPRTALDRKAGGVFLRPLLASGEVSQTVYPWSHYIRTRRAADFITVHWQLEDLRNRKDVIGYEIIVAALDVEKVSVPVELAKQWCAGTRSSTCLAAEVYFGSRMQDKYCGHKPLDDQDHAYCTARDAFNPNRCAEIFAEIHTALRDEQKPTVQQRLYANACLSLDANHVLGKKQSAAIESTCSENSSPFCLRRAQENFYSSLDDTFSEDQTYAFALELQNTIHGWNEQLKFKKTVFDSTRRYLKQRSITDLVQISGEEGSREQWEMTIPPACQKIYNATFTRVLLSREAQLGLAKSGISPETFVYDEYSDDNVFSQVLSRNLLSQKSKKEPGRVRWKPSDEEILSVNENPEAMRFYCQVGVRRNRHQTLEPQPRQQPPLPGKSADL